jgi:hypothetical protein
MDKAEAFKVVIEIAMQPTSEEQQQDGEHPPSGRKEDRGLAEVSTKSGEAWRPTPLPGYVALELIPRDVQCPMEDAEDVDIAVVLDQVRDSVVPVEEYPDAARRPGVSRAKLRKAPERSCARS